MVISVYSLIFFVRNKVYLIGSDAFYYMSIADSILENGKLKDITTIQGNSVKTTQNGIVLIHVLLSILGISNHDHLIPIVVLNYLFYLSGIYPLYRIARKTGMPKGWPVMLLIAVYLGAWHIYRINLLVLNDGIFNSSILWLVYLLIELVHAPDIEGSHFVFTKSTIMKLLGISLVLIVLVQFRLGALLVIGSAVLSAIAIKNFRAAIPFVTICGILSLSLILIYFNLDVTSFDSISLGSRFSKLFGLPELHYIKLQLWKTLPRLVAGLSPLSSKMVTLCFSIFPLSMTYFLYRGYKEKDFSKVFVSLICLSGLWFTTVSNWPNARVIWYTFPLIYLIIFNFTKLRPIGYVLVFIVFLQSFQQFYIGFGRGPVSKLFLHIYENRISLPQDEPLLLTWKARHSYFFLNTRSYRAADDDDGTLDGHITFPKELNWDLIKKRDSLYVLGDSTYIASAYSQVQDMATSNGYKFETNSLTPDLEKFEGWALVELELEKN